MTNYRPISVISVVAKIAEKLLYNQIYNYLHNYNLLLNSQHGFRPLHSTVTALLDITNEWYTNIDIYWETKWDCVSGSEKSIRYCRPQYTLRQNSSLWNKGNGTSLAGVVSIK
jgi:hypothetical protein